MKEALTEMLDTGRLWLRVSVVSGEGDLGRGDEISGEFITKAVPVPEK